MANENALIQDGDTSNGQTPADDNQELDLSFLADANAGQSGSQDTALQSQLAALQASFATLQADHAAETQRRKSLEGQFKQNNPQEAQARETELMKIISGLTQGRQQTPSEPAFSVQLPDGLKAIFDEQAPAMEQLLSAVAGPLHSKVGQLEAVIARLEQQVRLAPMDMLKAADTDGVFHNEDFDTYMKDGTGNPLGLSLYDQIKAMGGNSPTAAASLMAKAKASFMANTQKAKTEANAAVALSKQPSSKTMSQGGQEQSTPRSQNKQEIERRLIAAYSDLVNKPATQEIIAKRMRLASEAARHGVTLD